MSAAELFETGISELRLKLADGGCPDIVIERTVSRMQAEFEWAASKVMAVTALDRA